MSHFYSGIQGSRGEATRAGTKDSGIGGYVQGWTVRLDADMAHNSREDRDEASLTLGAGPSNYRGGRLRLDFPNAEEVVDALGIGDPKIEAIRKRLYAEIDKLCAEAPKALARKQRADRAAQRERERAEIRRVRGLDEAA